MTESPLPPTQELPDGAIPPPAIQAPGVPHATVNRRPTAVLVIGILLLVYGGCCALILLISALMYISNFYGYASWMSGSMIFPLLRVLVAAILTITIGIGLVRVLPWARKGAIYALLVIFALNTTASLMALYQVRQLVSEPIMREMIGTVETAVYLRIALPFVIGASLTALFIYLLTRPQVVQAFRAAGEK